MLFVGGDQMMPEETVEMSVPLSRAGPVMPGEEVDVAVEMVAPPALGRYLGYWRLLGPRGRKFGQGVWCHVQVVDPPAPEGPAPSDVELDRTLAEIAKKKSDLASKDADPVDDDDATLGGTSASAASQSSTPGPNGNADDIQAVAKTLSTTTLEAAAPQVESEVVAASDSLSEDGVLVTEGMALEAAAATAPSAAHVEVTDPDPNTPAGVALALKGMGFADSSLIEAAIAKHGCDIAQCAASLAVASEWDQALDDLEEMGFPSRELNKTLMFQNDGNLKRTIKALVEEA
jgi:hypothetical protein